MGDTTKRTDVRSSQLYHPPDPWRQGHETRIPHRSPSGVTRRIWHNAYSSRLIDLYALFAETVDERHPGHRIRWDDNATFNDFSRFVFGVSSGYVTPYLEEELGCEELEDDF